MSKLHWIMHKQYIFWVIFALGVALALAGITYSHPLPQGDDILYLLSSVSQGLAAIFTLVFVITIFGAQMMRKFTAMDRMIDKWTISLMIIFAIGIILPLIQLRSDEYLLKLNFVNTARLSISIDLGIATFCVLAIIPYLIRVNRIMKYDGGVSKLSEQASEAIDSNHKVTASNRISELAELCMSAVEDMLESEASKIVNIIKVLGNSVADKGWDAATFGTLNNLEQIGLNCVKKELDGVSLERYGFIVVGGERLGSATKEVLEAIKEMGVKAVDKELKKSDFPIAVDAIKGLESIGVNAIKYDLSDDTVSASCSGLFEIGVKVAERKLGFLGNPIGLLIDTSSMPEKENLFDKTHIVENLKEIAHKAYEKEFEVTPGLSMVYLWILGAFVMKQYPDDAREMTAKLRNSNKQVIKNLFGNNDIRERAREYIKEKYPQLESELNAFEELYNAAI